MTPRTILLAIAASLAALPAHAGDLPQIKLSATNTVPACATPGRLAAFVEARNPKLEPRFAAIAVDYMRHGEDLKLRWDYAFFQMLVETGNLSFRRGNGQPGDVKPKQNNFAGLGATGNGEPGESFPDVGSGVRAHLQHVLLYAGEVIENPVAERTRKVQEWGILKSWQKALTRPINFRDLTSRWSPGDKTYAASIEAVADKFYQDFCKEPDPKPELVAEARRGRTTELASEAPKPEKSEKIEKREKAEPPAKIAETPTPAATVGTEMAKKAAERGKAENAPRSALGAAELARTAAATATPTTTDVQAPAATAPAPVVTAAAPQAGAGLKIINRTDETPAAPPPPAAKPEANAKPQADKGQPDMLAPSEPSKCRVWTASYGGQKAVIIRVANAPLTHFTVLGVNEGSEKTEAEAYIARYAPGGRMIAEFPNQEQALDKAFVLCPEG